MLTSEKEKNFARGMKKQYAIHANDNFLTQMDGTLNGTAKYKTRMTVRKKILENCDEFWKHLTMKKKVWGSSKSRALIIN
ncbi:hypothetical protein B9Z55_022908 [Caenorhabditis nigoni]|uniref:Uncharacterized protein n=1 Tax=Caenorhabditis nigoni TaxID=1611254 RepID=A0A2G5SMZ9_9PELO|nr:hypothetical protein B9Z55_022908 [Caenorhabditis nigoni]